MQVVRFQNLGQLNYQEAWDYQTGLHRNLIDNKLKNKGQAAKALDQKHYFLVVEHPPVYTLGRSGSMENLLLSEAELQARGMQYFPINRGGDITYHGPGQIVGYPILDLDCFFTDVHRYVRFLEEMVIRTLADFGVEAGRIKDYTGVWCPPQPKRENGDEFWSKYRKICAIGVHLSRWVTLHGFAFNINTILEHFNYIVPCGIVDTDKTITSLERETGASVPLEEVHQALKKHFTAIFDCQLLDV